MSTEGDRQFVEALAERAALGDRNKMQPMMGIVTELGTGDFDGMVRVRRTPHEPPGSPARPFYYVFGELPIVGAEVFALSNFATGVVMGTTAGSGYDTVAEAGTPVAQQPQLNFGAGFDVADNAGASRTDVTLDLTEVSIPAQVSYKTIQEEGAARTQRDNLNFGPGFDVADNSGSSRTDVTLDKTEMDLKYQEVADKDSGLLTARPRLHVGQGLIAQDDAVNNRTTLDLFEEERKATGLFRVHLSANQLNIPNTTETKVNFDSEAWDLNNYYNTSTMRYTPFIAGYYQFMAGIRILPGVANNYVRLYLRASGVTTFRLAQSTAIDTADCDCGGASPPVFADGIDDYFEVYIWHDFGVGTSDIIASTVETYFGGYFLGKQ